MTQSELMDVIFERPGLYIGYASVIPMQAFIDGYGYGSPDLRDSVYDGFTQWVADRREVRGQYSWSAIATLVGTSEQAAFTVAKEFWEEYKKSLREDPLISN